MESLMTALKTNLWKHQQAGLEFLVEKGRGLLAYDMGTGKTLTTIARIAMLPKGSKILIVCPKAVIPTWPAELSKHLDRKEWPYDVIALTRGGGKRKAGIVSKGITSAAWRGKVVVVNYETAMAAAMAPTLLGVNWDMVVFDESHKIKNPTGKASKFCAKVKAPVRVALTGTPMPHSPLDIFSQARALSLSLYGYSFVRFRTKYAVFDPDPIYGPGGKPIRGAKRLIGWRDMDHFKRELSKWAVQVKAEDVLDLPEKRDVKISVLLTEAEEKAYAEMSSDLITLLDTGVIAASNALDRLLKLAQMTGGACKNETGDVIHVGTSKKEALVEILDGLPIDEPIVCFARFRSDLAAIHEAAASVKRESCELSGSRNELAEWKDGKGTVIAVQLQSGGAGIDLTRACKAVYYSVSFSLGDYDQSRARIHRPGQERRVTYFHLAAQGTIDEMIYGLLRKRRDLVEGVLAAIRKRAPSITP